MTKRYQLLLTAALLAFSLQAKVTLPALFADHMVFQQNTTAKMWGWAQPNEEITVIASWNHKAVQTMADNHANWSVLLETPEAGGPHTLTIMGSNTIHLTDVMVGEVWLCSGQSNMEWSANSGFDNSNQEVLMADNPYLRLFRVPPRAATSPQLDLEGSWTQCNPETMREFSAVAYFFGRNLAKELKIPIGLIHSSWGGTPAEAWTNPQVISQDPQLAQAAKKLPEVPWCPSEPGSTYNAMIAPMIPFSIAGVIWYQGESNTVNYETYTKLFSSMINNWRDEWKSDFPFYYVQIAPYQYETAEVGVLIREAQTKTMVVPNTGMVVISDIGNIKDIHPRNKQDVGLRLANWALARTYGREGMPFSGPLYKEMKIEGNKIRLFFDYAESGLTAKGEDLSHFEIAGKDGRFVPAKATIDGQTIVAEAPGLEKPSAVRFGWSNSAEPNLFNGAGLPASAFRTDH